MHKNTDRQQQHHDGEEKRRRENENETLTKQEKRLPLAIRRADDTIQKTAKGCTMVHKHSMLLDSEMELSEATPVSGNILETHARAHKHTTHRTNVATVLRRTFFQLQTCYFLTTPRNPTGMTVSHPRSTVARTIPEKQTTPQHIQSYEIKQVQYNGSSEGRGRWDGRAGGTFLR